jgi:hypothetical protein
MTEREMHPEQDGHWDHWQIGELLHLRDSLQTQVASLKADAERLRAALTHSITVIQTWHNMDTRTPQEASSLWDIYWRNAPEMKPIRAALVGETEGGK